jgi:RNA recognition motif-containing protein
MIDLNNPNADENNSDGKPFLIYPEGEILQTEEADKRSIFVKNVDYQSNKDQITEHFKSCGKINRVTIIYDKYTQHPKG